MELNDPCVMCGLHEQVTEYFDDELVSYCTTHEEYVNLSEFEDEMQRIEDMYDHEMEANDGRSNGDTRSDDRGVKPVATERQEHAREHDSANA